MPQKRGALRKAKLAVVPCLSLFDLPEERERGREKKEERERRKKRKRQALIHPGP